MRRAILIGLLAATAATFAAAESEKLDYPMIGRIRDEGMSRSQVMDLVSWLSDVYGPRRTLIRWPRTTAASPISTCSAG